MNTTRKDFGTTIATLARLYKQAERSGDVRRARLYANAVEVLLDAWPSDPEPKRLPTRSGWMPREEKTLVGLGGTRDRLR